MKKLSQCNKKLFSCYMLLHIIIIYNKFASAY